MVSRWWKRLAIAAVAVALGWASYVVVWGRIQAGVGANIYLTRCIQVGMCPSVDKLFPPIEKKGN